MLHVMYRRKGNEQKDFLLLKTPFYLIIYLIESVFFTEEKLKSLKLFIGNWHSYYLLLSCLLNCIIGIMR